MLATFTFLSPLTAALAMAIAASLLAGFALLRLLSGPPAAVARRWGLIGIRSAAVVTLLLILVHPTQARAAANTVDFLRHHSDVQ